MRERSRSQTVVKNYRHQLRHHPESEIDQRTVPWSTGSEPTLVLGRGYCGHEHIQQFGLINMNARLYDPILGRFLSPDPYVQMPDCSQNYNRYSYCMNSPLMYVDKDGKISFLAVVAIFGGIFATGNTVAHAIRGDINSIGDFWGYFSQGAITGAIIGAVWQGSSVVPFIGKTLHGIMTGYGYAQGVVSGTGLALGLINDGLKGIGNCLELILGNFYLDENRDMFSNIIRGTSRHSYEMLQTLFGHTLSQYYNVIGMTSRVDFLGGATFSTFEKEKVYKGVSIGNYINIWNKERVTGVFDKYVSITPIYMHEYGHTFDSNIWGLLYLPVIGFHSMLDVGDEYCWTELRANRFAKNYFDKYYGVNWNGTYNIGGTQYVIEDDYHTHY